MMEHYFTPFEHRQPPPPIPHSVGRELLWQFLATVALALGAWYISWRWMHSINWDALWFSLPLLFAETMSYIGLCIFALNLWKVEDTPRQEAPRFINDCVREQMPEHRISVDVFFPTFNEDVDLVRLGIRDAKNMRYPHPIDVAIHVLDDGKREEMRRVAEEEGVNYITRDNNVGFKAGNLRNAMEQTHGDFIVICDADTRPFPTLLEHTLGYFRDPDVAWVQTPQWFFDLTEGVSLKHWLKKYLWLPGYAIGASIEAVVGEIRVGHDVFVNDPQMFFDVIQRRRNWANASFCCGAGSVHRREAVMQAAMQTYSDAIDGHIRKMTSDVENEELRVNLSEVMRKELALETEVVPYKFHVSEDIYTSIVLHSYKERTWKSVYHPFVESKMLSPQDLLSWTIQRFKYAGGSLDIFLHDNPLFRKSNLSWAQRAMYFATFFSYLAGVWNIIFLLSPIIYLFSGVSPVNADSIAFAAHFLPFILATECAFLVGTWGVAGWQGMASYLSFFPVNLRAIWTVLRGEKIKFPVTPKSRQEGNFLHLVIPQVAIIVLTLSGLLYSGTMLALGKNSNYSGFITNCFWGGVNIFAMSGIVMAALWKPQES